MRVRLTTAVALLVALALTGAGMIVYLVEGQRLREQMTRQVDQDVAELVKLQRSGVDPATGERFGSVASVLDSYLARSVPEDNEVLVTWYAGRAQQVSASADRPGRELASSPQLARTVRPLIARNGSAEVDLASYGRALVTVQGVRGDGRSGALVVVTYLEEGRADLLETMRTYAVVALMSLVLITSLAAWQSGRLLAPLRTLRLMARDVGEGDLSRRLPVHGNDDITALTRTVNGMLGRLESAFVDQRQFLDDAGHELKTPLTVLRGHLELIDTGSPEDVAETRELLLDEVDRMSRLVGDLLLLAKSDRPDFVTLRPVDLGRLTEELVAKARGLGDRAWTLDALAVTKVGADEQRLTQAVLQLAANAVAHTRPGDVVAIGSSYDENGVRLWVRDTGPGVPMEERDRIFARFGRGTRPASEEGFGLGLSIVRAIATAHGGAVTLEDPDPPGAMFVITLPTPRGSRPAHRDPEASCPES